MSTLGRAAEEARSEGVASPWPHEMQSRRLRTVVVDRPGRAERPMRNETSIEISGASGLPVVNEARGTG